MRDLGRWRSAKADDAWPDRPIITQPMLMTRRRKAEPSAPPAPAWQLLLLKQTTSSSSVLSDLLLTPYSKFQKLVIKPTRIYTITALHIILQPYPTTSNSPSSPVVTMVVPSTCCGKSGETCICGKDHLTLWDLGWINWHQSSYPSQMLLRWTVCTEVHMWQGWDREQDWRPPLLMP